jgi:hypothetical protein
MMLLYEIADVHRTIDDHIDQFEAIQVLLRGKDERQVSQLVRYGSDFQLS